MPGGLELVPAVAARGLWENRYAVMSDAAVLSYESISAAARLTTPLPDGCATCRTGAPLGVAVARRFLEALAYISMY